MKIFLLFFILCYLTESRTIGDLINSGYGIQISTCTGACSVGTNCTQQTDISCQNNNGIFNGFYSEICSPLCNGTCSENQTCTNNTCIDACSVCYHNQTCVNHRCVNNCFLCLQNQTCVNNTCVDSCSICSTNHICINSTCIFNCSVCGFMQTCGSGGCIGYLHNTVVITTSGFAILVVLILVFLIFIFGGVASSTEPVVQVADKFTYFDNVIDIDELSDTDDDQSTNKTENIGFNSMGIRGSVETIVSRNIVYIGVKNK